MLTMQLTHIKNSCTHTHTYIYIYIYIHTKGLQSLAPTKIGSIYYNNYRKCCCYGNWDYFLNIQK